MPPAATDDAVVTGDGSRRLQLLDVAPFLTLVLVAAMASRLVQDSSFLWHIRAGSAQRALTAVFTTDPFSFTRTGDPWRTQSWLVELLYSSLESTFSSYAWINWMVFVVGSATVLLIGLSLRDVVRSPVSITIALVPVLWLVAPFLRPRPVVFSFLLLAALVVVLQHRRELAWAIVPIIWIWAASHGSWVIGGLLIVLEWLRTGDRRLFKAGAVALVATLLTAHGFGAWGVLSEFAGAGAALDVLVEWNTPNFTSLLQGPFVLLIVGIILASMRGRIVPRDLVVIVPFLILGMSANRSVVPAAIVLAPWAALALPDIRVPSSSRPPAVIIAAFAVVAAFVLLPMLTRPLGTLDAERFPSATLQAAMEGRRTFYSDVMGGYLIFDEWPETLVYIDDRAELYGGDVFVEYLEAVSGSYEELFATYGFDAAVTERDWLLNDRLLRDGWTVVAEDEDLVLYYAPAP